MRSLWEVEIPAGIERHSRHMRNAEQQGSVVYDKCGLQ